MIGIPTYAMRHRIIQHSGRRFSVKLDDLVWNNLEALAAKADLRLNQLVQRVVERAGEGANTTGELRPYCLDEELKQIKNLERAVEDAATHAGGDHIRLFSEARPAPS